MENSSDDVPDTAHVMRSRKYTIIAEGFIFGDGQWMRLIVDAKTRKTAIQRTRKLHALGLDIREVTMRTTYWNGHGESTQGQQLTYSIRAAAGIKGVAQELTVKEAT